jgi:hypothetical protein
MSSYIHIESKTNEMIKKWNKAKREFFCDSDLMISFHESEKQFTACNKDELNNKLKEWKNLLKQGKIFILKENCKTTKIDDTEIHLLVIQSGSFTDISSFGLMFDFFVEGLVCAFRNKKNRDNCFEWLDKFNQIKLPSSNDDTYGECPICMEETTLFESKCCKQPICGDCLFSKKSNVCPFCRNEI